MEAEHRRISFTLRMINNRIRAIICKSVPKSDMAPQSQLQGGILGFLYHHREEAVYQKDIEKEFRISRATATNTLQVMEKNGLIVRKSQDKDARLKRIFMTEGAEKNHMKVEAHMKRMDDTLRNGICITVYSRRYLPAFADERSLFVDFLYMQICKIVQNNDVGIITRCDGTCVT